MANYICNLLFCKRHKAPDKPQHSPHKHCKIIYGTKQQFSQADVNSAKLDDAGIKQVQRIVRVILYYTRAVNNKLLVALSAIGSQQAVAT